MTSTHAGRAREWLRRQLFEPVDAASLAVFRIVFGLSVLGWTVWAYFKGWFLNNVLAPVFHFKYPGFGWVLPLPDKAMFGLLALLAVSALFVALGLFYRKAIVAVTVLFTYFFLIDFANYQNHYYFICLLGFLLCFVPANCLLSLDARRNPGLRRDQVPGWALFILRFQVAMPYVWGAIAKLDYDWLTGRVTRIYLLDHDSVPILGQLAHFKATWFVFAYGGILFDALVVPGIMWKKTRWPFAVAVLLFHAVNASMYNIDVFPYLMLGATTLFLEPDWPRGFARRIGPLQKMLVGSAPGTFLPAGRPKLVALGVLAFVFVQVLMPMRQFFIPGKVTWHEYGHYFSWRMLTRAKSASVKFVALYQTDDGEMQPTQIDVWPYLTRHQYNRLAGKPDMIWQLAHFLGDALSQGRAQRVPIHVNAVVSLNRGKPQRLVDTTVDIGAEPFTLLPPNWINQFDESDDLVTPQ